MISNIMTQLNNNALSKDDLKEDLVRHQILNSIRASVHKFKVQYGSSIVLAYDNPKSWRRDIYPYYKASRRKALANDQIDWNMLFEYMNKIKAELRSALPYWIIEVEGAEADDIIGHLVRKVCDRQKVMIISGDKDFLQLHVNDNVKQYDPIHKKFINCKYPAQNHLKLHIMEGDTGDGIPNFLSPDDCFVMGKRQTPLRTKKKDLWLHQEPTEFCDEMMLRNFKRNEQLIDLTHTPENIIQEIDSQWMNVPFNTKSELYQYFMANRLHNLIQNIGDF